MFKEVLRFINAKDVGQIFTRKELKEHLAGLWYNTKGATMDGYRNTLRAAGYLEITGRGVYKILKKIPDNMTINKLLTEAYPK